MRIKSGEAEWVLKTKPAVSNRAYTDKTHLEGVKEFLLDRALTFSSQNESMRIVAKQNNGVAEYRYEFKISQLLEAKYGEFCNFREKLIHTVNQQRRNNN
jgi:hypothetical protein